MELPFVVIFCSSESSEAPARNLEERGDTGWVSDARHRFPVRPPPCLEGEARMSNRA